MSRRESGRIMAAHMMARAGAALVGVAALAGCGPSGDSGIAHLADVATPTPSSSTSTKTAEEQALAFAQCMRDKGVDFPDPTVDANGNPSFRGAFDRSQSGGFNPGDTSFRDALDACRGLMSGFSFGGGVRGGAFDSTAIQDAMLAYTECLRDQGLDVGDITFGGPGLRGGGTGPGGADPAPTATAAGGGPPAGRFQGGGDRTDRFARILGQDPTDPAWIAANAVCEPALQDAMSSAFPGRPSSTAGGN